MLLVLKYIDNEIIKNRDYNTKYHANRKIVVVIDEAHVFIDAKFPIALDFMFQLAKRIRKYNGMQIVITQNIKDFVGSEELARKSTAIINACQYSFIFSLAPNDMQDLVKLYEKAGGVNETEQEEIVQAPRGQAFVVMSPTSRSSFTIETAPGITQMFEEKDYQSRYFSGEQGEVNWEQFVGVSRAAHEETMLRNASEERSQLEERTVSSNGVTLNIYEEDEYEAMQEETKPSGVTLNILDEEPEKPVKRPEPEVPTAQVDMMPKMPGGAEMAVFSQIANALGRMADAADGGRTVPIVAPAPAAPAPADAISVELERRLQEKDDEIRRLREEFEQLKTAKQEEPALPEEAEEDDVFNFDFEEEPEEEMPDEDDEFGGEEEDGELFSLFGLGEEGEEDEEDAFADEDEEEDPIITDEDEDEEAEESDDETGDDDDFMSSFCRFAESLQSMTVFERMKANGTSTSAITLEELAKEAETQVRQRREKRASGQE